MSSRSTSRLDIEPHKEEYEKYHNYAEDDLPTCEIEAIEDGIIEAAILKMKRITN